MEDILIIITETIGTIAFAISGASVAIKKRLDLLGVIVLGCTTACGGGLIRDIILNDGIPSIFENGIYLLIAFITSIILFVIVYFMQKKEINMNSRIINIFDATGLGIFVCLGASKAISLGYINNFLLVIFVAIITGVGGGILRDILVGEIPAVLRKHIYAIAALVGAMVYYGMILLKIDELYAITFSIIIVVIIRILASEYKWSLPKIKEIG